MVLLNAIMGYVQEAARRVGGRRVAGRCRRPRRTWFAMASVRVPAAEIVPGDIILVEEGDTIPADARVIESTSLQTAEAALTGESLPVAKDTDTGRRRQSSRRSHNMMYSGTAVTYGRGTSRGRRNGMQTEMGRIAGMLKDAPDETTPLQEELDRVGKLLGIVVVVIAVVMIATISSSSTSATLRRSSTC